MAIWASTKTCLLAIGRPGGDCTTSLSACEGSLDKVETISDARFVRVSGWLAYSTAPIEAVRLLDAGGREVVYAITGQARPDLVRTLGAEALHAGYRGYSFSNAAGTSVAAQGENRHGALCRMNVVLPDTLFSVKPTVQEK